METETHTRRSPHEDEGRDQDDAATRQGTPKIPINHKLGERHETEYLPHSHWKEPMLMTP